MRFSNEIKEPFYILIVKGILLILTYSTSLLLSKILTPSDFGVFYYALQLANVTIWITLYGTTIKVYKVLGKLNKEKEKDKISDEYSVSITRAIIISIFLISAAALFYVAFPTHPLRLTVLFSTFLLIPLTFIRTTSSYLNALFLHKESNFLQNIPPAIIFLITILIVSWISEFSTAGFYLSFYLFSLIAAAIIIYLYQFRRGVGLNSVRNLKTKLIKAFQKEDRDLFFVTFLGFLNTRVDIIILGFLFVSTSDIAVYIVCTQLVIIPNVVFQTLNQIVSPYIGKLFVQNKLNEAQTKVRVYTTFAFLISISVTITYYLCGAQILAIWGDLYTKGVPVLIILAIAQNVNIFFGSCGVVLSICGKENLLFKISFLSLAIGIPVIYLLSNSLSLMGVAIGSLCIIFIENLLKFLIVKKELGITTLPINFLKYGNT